VEVISPENTVAQIDPKRLCEFLLEQCASRGVIVHQPANVVSVAKDARDELAGVRIVKADGTETDSMYVFGGS
jgi:glycine/D-amino acid oxidase-like deaminating enzyme